MPICFIISPIGETGSDIRMNADDLRDMIIKPVLQPMGFEVIRGDHRSEGGQIDLEVIRSVQEADLCIVDLSLPNPNVYYEFGRRDETGKPMILLKSKGSPELPVDVATRKYIEYDLDNRRSIVNTMENLRTAVAAIADKGFESSGSGSSLSELAEILKRVERKIDRLESNGSNGGGTVVTPPDGGEDGNPIDLFMLALQQKNIPMAERAMDQLKYRFDTLRWLDQVVEQVAVLGSRRAGDIMIENAIFFMDSDMTPKDKSDYLGCLVTNLLRTDREIGNYQLVEQICEPLHVLWVNESTDLRIQPYNQLNRLYYGIYLSNKETVWLEKAIDALQKALKLDDDLPFLHYNLALCLEKLGNLDEALQHLLQCVENNGGEDDDDHLEALCNLLHRLNDPRVNDYLERLETINPVKASLLRGRFRR